MQIVLASRSVYRAELLGRILEKFTIDQANINEMPLAHESPTDLAHRLAKTKAKKVAIKYPNAIIIGSDQVCVLNNGNSKPIMMGKPGNFAAAFKQLQQCSGHTMDIYTACCLIDTTTSSTNEFIDRFSIRLNQLDDENIKNYLLREQPYDCAGSIKSEGLGIALIEKFSGDDPTTLIGLPLIKLVRALASFGINVL